MKPAPFVKIHYQDPHTQCAVITDPDDVKTSVYDAASNEMWSMDVFLGRKRLFLSPDCETLLAFGSMYFGSTLKFDPSEVVVEVYVLGTLQEQLTFKQFFGLTLAEALHKYHIPQRGGGWIESADFVNVIHVAWSARLIQVTLIDGVTRAVEF